MNLPVIEQITSNSSKQERQDAFIRYCQKIVDLYPNRFLPIGVKRRWWNLLKLEHPFTRLIDGN